MIKYKITRNDPYYRNGINFDQKYSMLSELNVCDNDYILNDIVPSMEKIWRGEKVIDPNYNPERNPMITEKYQDYYSFGFEATIVEFRRNGPSIVWYEYGDKSMEVPSADVYKFMTDWAKAIRKWQKWKKRNDWWQKTFMAKVESFVKKKLVELYWFLAKIEVEVSKVGDKTYDIAWVTFLGLDNLEKDPDLIVNTINKVKGHRFKINRKHSYSRWLSKDGVGIKLSCLKEEIVSVFPLFRSSREVDFQSEIIQEWEESKSTDAELVGIANNRLKLRFFAIDYFEHKKIYRQNKNLKINLAALAYRIEEANTYSSFFTENAIGYRTNGLVENRLCYYFQGVILNIEKSINEVVPSFILTIQLDHGENDKNPFILDVFLNKENLFVKKLIKGQIVSGVLHFQGRIADGQYLII